MSRFQNNSATRGNSTVKISDISTYFFPLNVAISFNANFIIGSNLTEYYIPFASKVNVFTCTEAYGCGRINNYGLHNSNRCHLTISIQSNITAFSTIIKCHKSLFIIRPVIIVLSFDGSNINRSTICGNYFVANAISIQKNIIALDISNVFNNHISISYLFKRTNTTAI